MIIRKSLQLSLACGLLLSVVASVQAKTDFSQLAKHAGIFAAAASANYLGYYLESKLKAWETKFTHEKKGLISAVNATWFLSNIYILRAALTTNLCILREALNNSNKS